MEQFDILKLKIENLNQEIDLTKTKLHKINEQIELQNSNSENNLIESNIQSN